MNKSAINNYYRLINPKGITHKCANFHALGIYAYINLYIYRE